MLIIMAAAAMLLGGIEQDAQAQTAPTTPPQTAQAEQEADEGDRVICRREHVLGSNRPQRICMTKREWDAIREASRDNLDRLGRGTPEGLPDTAPAGR